MSRSDRYAVYTWDVTPAVRELLGDDLPHYTVWDRELKQSVPFGGYGKMDGAQRRAYRMNHPTGWDTGEFRLCIPCADAHRPGTGTDRTGWRPVQGALKRSCQWCGASLLRNDLRVKSCGVLMDHSPHAYALREEVHCPGNGPSQDPDLAEREPDTFLGPPCVCGNSVRPRLGYCPPEGDPGYGSCPVRSGRLTR